MKQEFFKDTLQSSFIKNLLISTPLPICKTVVVGDYIIKGRTYIFKNNVIACDNTGYLGNGAVFRIICPYYFGDKLNKLTNDFNSYFSYYDSDTHERLGKYLRCYRDMFGIDLMPFYNCFSGRYQEGFFVSNNVLYEANDTSDYKVFKVPIKFNKTYTIAMDSDKDIYVCPVFMNGENLLKVKLNGALDETNLTDYLTKDITYFNSMSFRAPKTFRIDNVGDYAEMLDTYENNLFMLIQVDVNSKSSLVVLEGDYSNLRCKKVFNPENINSLNYPINSACLSELSLLQLSDGGNYPFSDRLVEYLLLNVITPRDDVTENVERVQAYTGLTANPRVAYGVWTDELRKIFYDFAQNSDNVKHLDITGYIDKDLEKAILRYKEEHIL